MKNRNMNVRNFGLGSRDMGRALLTAYRENGNSFASNQLAKNNLKNFADFVKTEFEIKDLRKLERSHVEAYAAHLNARFETGEVAGDRIRNQLSHLNQALENARRDQTLRLSAKDAGFPSKSGISTHDKSVPQYVHEAAKSTISERLSVQLDLQRAIGLRFKESCLIDAKNVLAEAQATGVIAISSGTKGGRDREIPVTSEQQLQALQRAAEIQGSWRSLVPENQSWSEYQAEAYREIRSTNVLFHGERHAYANSRYETLVGLPTPVQAGIPHRERHTFIAKELGISIEEAKAVDHAARMQVSRELGHSRIAITNSYLG